MSRRVGDKVGRRVREHAWYSNWRASGTHFPKDRKIEAFSLGMLRSRTDHIIERGGWGFLRNDIRNPASRMYPTSSPGTRIEKNAVDKAYVRLIEGVWERVRGRFRDSVREVLHDR